MTELSSVGFLTAVVAGIVSFLSPCVLPLVPGYVSYVAGRSLDDGAAEAEIAALHMLGLSLCFVLGFTTVFSLLGAGATTLGRLFLSYRYEAGIVGGVIVILFGLFTTGLLRLSRLQRESASLAYTPMARAARRPPRICSGFPSPSAGPRASAQSSARSSRSPRPRRRPRT